jgi:hypothetical protein
MTRIGQNRLAGWRSPGHHWSIRGEVSRFEDKICRQEVMAWKLVLGIVILVLIGGAGLAIYGGQLTPERERIEQVLPDDRFPR